MSGRGASGISVPALSIGGEGAHVSHKQLSTQYLAQGQSGMAYGTLVDLWHQQPSLATAHYGLAHQLLADCGEKTSRAPYECTAPYLLTQALLPLLR